MAVVLQHFSTTAQLHAANKIPSIVPHGYLAVDLFFILSGFIMCYTYLPTFERQGMSAFGGFLLKRVARIAPLNLAVLALFVAVGQGSIVELGKNIIYPPAAGISDIFANALMLQGIGIGLNLNGPSWSISAEFAAYLAFPLLIRIAFSSWRIARTAFTLASVAAICYIAACHPHLNMDTETIAQSLIRCFAEFSLGMATYRFYSKLGPERIQFLGSDLTTFGVILGIGGFVLTRYDLPAVLLFPWLIISLSMNKGRVARFMAFRPFYSLGLISFSLYLLHQLFRPLSLMVVQQIHPTPLTTVQALLFALLGSLCVIPFAWLAFRYVEMPGRKLVRALQPHPIPVR